MFSPDFYFVFIITFHNFPVLLQWQLYKGSGAVPLLKTYPGGPAHVMLCPNRPNRNNAINFELLTRYLVNSFNQWTTAVTPISNGCYSRFLSSQNSLEPPLLLSSSNQLFRTLFQMRPDLAFSHVVLYQDIVCFTRFVNVTVSYLTSCVTFIWTLSTDLAEGRFVFWAWLSRRLCRRVLRTGTKCRECDRSVKRVWTRDRQGHPQE